MHRKINTLKKIIILNLRNFLRYFLRYFNKAFNRLLSENPLISQPISSITKYENLYNDTLKKEYEEVLTYEKNTNGSIDKDWLSLLAKYTQITIKINDLCYAHGRILYSALKSRIESLNNKNQITILETGTARGFSSLCMAKCLSDMNQSGTILTLDQIPHKKNIYWNSVSDHLKGKISRSKLLEPWNDLIENHIIFLTGDSRVIIDSLNFMRVHFAFLDGCHTYQDVHYEFNSIKKCQKTGDIIVFDDYTLGHYDGVIKAVNEICEQNSYSKLIIKLNDKRSVLVATKI